MRYLLALLFIGFLLVLWSCKTTKDTSDLNKLTKVIEMYKSPCFGECPTFSLSIYEGGFVSFNGRAFTDKQGIYVRQLSKSTYKTLLNTFKAANLEQYKDHYPSNLPDLPKVTIKYFSKGGVKSIQGDTERPEAIKDLEKQLDKIANGEGWVQREGPAKEEVELSNELIIQFKPQADIPEWVERMEKYGTALVRELGPKSNRWLVQFDEQTIRAHKMLDLVKRSPEVQMAEFNKKIQLRDR